MKMRIFQINTDRDEHHRCFRGYDELPVSEGTGESKAPDSGIYDLVFEGDVDCKTLEEVYRMFNLNPPAGYKGRSLSVSDVVEIQNGKSGEITYHYCDTFGFREVFFDPDKCEVSPNLLKLDPDNQIRVLLVQPGKYPKEIKIDGSLESMQSVVGGNIEEYMPFEDEVALVCNEEGKFLDLPLNRAVYGEEKEMLDIIAGDFFLAYAPISSEKFLSMPDGLLAKYAEIFKYPERFSRTDEGIKALPYRPAKGAPER